VEESTYSPVVSRRRVVYSSSIDGVVIGGVVIAFVVIVPSWVSVVSLEIGSGCGMGSVDVEGFWLCLLVG